MAELQLPELRMWDRCPSPAPVFCLVAALCLSGDACGDDAGSRGAWSFEPSIAASFARVSSADIRGFPSGTRLAALERQASLGTVKYESGNLAVELGIDYQYTRYEYEGIPSRNRDLHRLQLPLHFESDLGPWRLQGYVGPGISTSSNVFKDFVNRGSADDVFAGGRAQVNRNSGAGNWFVGIAHDRRFGRSRTYPVAGIEVTPADALQLRLAVPDPALRLQLSERQSLEVRLFPAGHQWHVVHDDFSDDFDYRVEAWRAQLSWRIDLWEEIGLDISTGYEFERRHHLTADDGSRLDFVPGDEWLVAIGIRVGKARALYTHGEHL